MIRETILDTRFGESASRLEKRASELIEKYSSDKYPDIVPRDEFDKAIQGIFKLMGNCQSESHLGELKVDVYSLLQGICNQEKYNPGPHFAWLEAKHPSIDTSVLNDDVLYTIWRARDTLFPDRLKLD